VVKYIVTIFLLLLSVHLYAEQSDLEDPTKPLNYKVNSKPKVSRPRLPKLQSIFFDQQAASVIMNNKSYQTGQRVNGYLITRIKNDAVLLSYANKSYKLSLYTEKERIINVQ
jgi:hypothetical protein